jgi:hypothetical protein
MLVQEKLLTEGEAASIQALANSQAFAFCIAAGAEQKTLCHESR